MKFRGHETFYIRPGWLSKGLRQVTQTPDVFVSKTDDPMDVLGIGSNMVKSLRFWLQAVGLTCEPRSGVRVQRLTELGRQIFEHDRHLEETGTLQLLQYRLATNKDLATAWYYFFNEFEMSEFSADDFVTSLQNWIRMSDGKPAANRSLNDDFSCIVNTYVRQERGTAESDSAENNFTCQFRELGLMSALDARRKTYRKSTMAEPLDPYVALAIIAEQSDREREVAFSALLSRPGSLGRVFNLSGSELLNILYDVAATGRIRVNRTAGLDVIEILDPTLTFDDCVTKYYGNMEEE